VIPHKKQLFRGRRRIVKSWHRFYDPETGRYISADPLGIEAGLNFYKYVNNNPLTNFDSNGLMCITLGSFTIGKRKVLMSSSLVDISYILWAYRSRPYLNPSIVFPGTKVPNPSGIITNAKYRAIISCTARRTMTYEDKYNIYGTKIRFGICFSECQGSYFWDDSQEVLRGTDTDVRKEKDQVQTEFPSVHAHGLIPCTQWVNRLNSKG
jgi:RHS repeat-associated protein